MNQPQLKLWTALSTDGVLSRRQHPKLIGSIDRAVKNGQLVPLFPGTYAAVRSLNTLALALVDWDPDAVFVGGTAARLSWWPELQSDVMEAVTRRKLRRVVDGVKVCQRRIHPDLIVRHATYSLEHPSASALELSRAIGPSALDEALRRRAVSVASLRWAFSLALGRSGNQVVREYLNASRDNAWSHLERQGHELLRRARITRWKANYKVQLRSGMVFIDVAFPGIKLALEFDGWEFHRDRESFARDRRRDNELRLAGWVVLRFTVESMDEVVPQVLKFLRDVKSTRPA